jgi:hypothetical protein
MNQLIDLLLHHSQFITNIVQGYENDSAQIDNLLTLVCEDITKEKIIAILNGNLLCTADEIEPIWNFLYKYDIDIKDNFRAYCVTKIYEELDYKLNIIDMTTSIAALVDNTCINADEKCIDCDMAAEKGHLECLKYVHENGCQWNSNTCAYAARNNHLECLKYLHENGCKWNTYTHNQAAYNGHLDCLKYAHENGCPWNYKTCENAEWNCQFECLKYACENGCVWRDNILSPGKNYDLRDGGHLKYVKYAHEI